MTSAVSSATTVANADTALGLRSSTRMPMTAAALAPELMPMTSGLASGLRSIVWNVDPARPNASPTISPVSARGSRSVPTVKDAPSTSAPMITATTSESG